MRFEVQNRMIFQKTNMSMKKAAIKNGTKQLTNVFIMYYDSANQLNLKSSRKQSNETRLSEV